ncbi:MADS-box transcription factor 23 [Hibiscus syriacus]|uniref:MADS-box transcription factor 23 n=1 Tax=Hibiscus syriacus TaxID=106335 RepID=A0A6A3BWX4_HIBSY|nr:MADS-box transcription factor 23 [Hibiscus syriacus]
MDNNAMPNATQKKKTRSSRGRQRIEIKKLEDESKRQVTFSKRRKGLFKKAKALSTLCGVEVGIVTISKSGRFYVTDNIDAVLEAESSSSSLDHGIEERRVNAVRLEELSVQESSSSLPFVAAQQSPSLSPFVRELDSSCFRPFFADQDSSSLWPLLAEEYKSDINKHFEEIF